MNLRNATPKGATVYITDLKIRVGQSIVPIGLRDALSSVDLRDALNQGMVQLDTTDEERANPAVMGLVTFARLADMRREGRLLFAQVESAMKSNRPVDSLNIPVRPAVFELMN